MTFLVVISHSWSTSVLSFPLAAVPVLSRKEGCWRNEIVATTQSVKECTSLIKFLIGNITFDFRTLWAGTWRFYPSLYRRF